MRWTRFFVPDPAFNWYVRSVTLGAVVVALCFGSLLWWYHGKLLDLLGLYDMLQDPQVHHRVAEYSRLSLVVIGMGALGSAAFVIMMSMFFLHRISGPIYRLKSHILGIMDGDPIREVRFRGDDQLKDLADSFNELMAHLGHLETRAAAPSREPASEPVAELRAAPDRQRA